MASRNIEKRPVQLESLDELIAEVERLKTHGYTSRGNWTLGQTCYHLSEWMRFPMDGFPKPPLPIRAVMWVMKITVAKGMKDKILREGFSPGVPTAPETVPQQDQVDDQQGVDTLLETIGRLKQYTGELHPSPLFGPMDKAMLTKVSLLHAEHHLGYLEPRDDGTSQDVQ